MQHLRIRFDPIAHPDAVVTAPEVRFTVLTSRLIRMEYQPENHFEDHASQVFWYRNLPVPAFTVQREADALSIDTEHLTLRYTIGKENSLSVEVKALGVTWRYGDANPGNLLGTTRTLDQVSGHTQLEEGLLSLDGWSVVNDTHTLIFDENGWLQNRKVESGLDLYFFGYGHDYRAALKDYCRVAGGIPMLPRWALGNWWSRYWEYTEEELTALMREFREREVPLTVCIVDMDWHITSTGNESRGWTGYTWNRELFPEPERFVQFLHSQGLKTALNLHPADGIHPHEALYPQFAQWMGVGEMKPVAFAIEDPKFTQAYFEMLHHPFEDQGIDFWWMDWQQGRTSGKQGLDPLWWLNHLHFYDLMRNGSRRGFVFSRWGGLGNHRYPIGFSGDTVISWESLAYQPYFTATAANVGYTWWSHDIGGHYKGVEDDEMFARWVQYGVFSPIFRLHSTKNRYLDRRPWGRGEEVFRIARDAMQLRHALIPYLYSMAWRASQECDMVVAPMYHAYPEHNEAYNTPNQYLFGSELIAAPYITPADPATTLSRQVVWMPPAKAWFNFFTGEYVQPNTWNAVYGTLEEIPVYARAGAIVPMGPKVGWGGAENPSVLNVHVFPGDNNRFSLYEDDGESTAHQHGAYSLTTFAQQWEATKLTFTVEPVSGDTAHLPDERHYTIIFRGISQPAEVVIMVNDRVQPHDFVYEYTTESVEVGTFALKATDRLTITLSGDSLLSQRDRREETLDRMLVKFRLNAEHKGIIAPWIPQMLEDITCLSNLLSMLGEPHLRALVEVATGAGMEHITNVSASYQPLILWNNRQHPQMRYWLSQRNRWVPTSEGGALPASKIYHLESVSAWRLNVSYADMLLQTLESQPAAHE